MKTEQIDFAITEFFKNPTVLTLLGLSIIIIAITLITITIIKTKSNEKSLKETIKEQNNMAKEQTNTVNTVVEIIAKNSEQITKLVSGLENEKSYKEMFHSILETQSQQYKTQVDFNNETVKNLAMISTNLENLIRTQHEFQRNIIENQKDFEKKVDNNLNNLKDELHELRCNQIKINTIKLLNEKGMIDDD